MIKGIILDFNGTCYLDHDLNNYAWKVVFTKITGLKKDEDFELFRINNVDSLNKDYDYSKAIYDSTNLVYKDKDIYELSEYKEVLYRDKAKELNRNKLIDGLPEFLDYLKENNIPYCIASMAPKSNFDFYLEYLDLKKWFSYENIVHDEPKYPNKNPMYIDACKRININIEDALLFEDSPRIINKSLEVGIKNVIYVNSKNKDISIKEIKQTIHDFTEFDYKLISKVK